MTAPRLDLTYIRRVVQTGRELGWNASSIAIDEIEALLSIAEAAEALMSEDHSPETADAKRFWDEWYVDMRLHDALRAALAAVRKEEK